MKRNLLAGLACGLLMFCWAGQGSCAQVVGVVKNAAGQPVPGVKIQAIDESGTLIGQALSGPKGAYVIDGLKPGKYVFKLDPQATGVQAGNGVAYLGADGLTVDWTVSPDAMALDDATAGVGGAGSSFADSALTPANVAIVGGTVGGAVLGGLGAAGSLGGGSTTPSL
jgi:hypothetical protein